MKTPGRNISWHVELDVVPGRFDELHALTEEMVEFASAEDGVLVYERFASDSRQEVHIYERWSGSEAALLHLRAFSTQFAARFTHLVSRKRFTVYGQPTDELLRELTRHGATAYLGPMSGFALLAGSANPR